LEFHRTGGFTCSAVGTLSLTDAGKDIAYEAAGFSVCQFDACILARSIHGITIENTVDSGATLAGTIDNAVVEAGCNFRTAELLLALRAKVGAVVLHARNS
jgi:hypothetical protein